MKLQELRQLIREEMENSSSNPAMEIANHLRQALRIAESNIENAENFDLDELASTLENYIDELSRIKRFESY